MALLKSSENYRESLARRIRTVASEIIEADFSEAAE
jgi:hypothetical protein